MHVSLREEIEKLTPALRRFARALVVHAASEGAETADALVHEALARAWRADWGRRLGEPRLFLYAAIATANRQRLRGRGAQPRGQSQGQTLGRAQECAPAEQAGLRARDIGGGRSGDFAAPRARRGGLTEALDAMALDEREAYLLVALEGLDYAQAADVLGVTRQVLVARLLRARQHLGTRLEPSHHAADGRHGPPAYLRVVK